MYFDGLTSKDLILPIEHENYTHSFYVFVVRHPNRNKIIEKLKLENINVNISYPFPIHTMPPFKKFKKGDLKNTSKLSREIFSLPMYPALPTEKVEKVIKVLNKIC